MLASNGISRRRILKTSAAGLVAAPFISSLSKAARADGLVVGALYVGAKDDYGWNQSHAQGIASLKSIDGVLIREEERVPETIEVQKSMESMINLDGAKLIFATSFGYWDHMLKVAANYPDVQFLHAAPTVWKDGMPPNASSYNGFIDEAQYVSGVIAGHMTKTNKIGFVGAKPYPASLRNINAFALGARSVKPEITTHVIFTGDWVLPVKEAESVNTLADQDIDVVTCHVDSPKVVIETAERRGIFSSGYHCNQSVLAPNGYLTGAEWNWEKVYADYVSMIREGKTWSHNNRGGLQQGMVRNSPYGKAVTDAARANADDVTKKLTDGSFKIFSGPIKTNDGKEVIAASKSYASDDLWLDSMDWMAEGVIGSTTG